MSDLPNNNPYDKVQEDQVQETYRTANTALDARASSSARSAVLAAAARAAQSGPRPLASETEQTKTNANAQSKPGWLRFRQPLAIAASVVFGIGIGLTLLKSERNSGLLAEQQVAMVQPDTKPVLKAETETAQESKPQEMNAPAAFKAATRNSIPQTSVIRAPAAPRPAAKIATDQQAKPAQAGVLSVRTAESDTEAKAVASRGESTHASENLVAAAPAAEPQAKTEGIRAPAASPPTSPPAPISLSQAARARTAETRISRAPEDWVAQIMVLRKKGQSEKADQELAALRLAYPQYVIPAQALP